MAIDKIFVTNTTQLTLSDRFTILQSVRPALPPQRPRADPYLQSNAAAQNRNKMILNRLGVTPVAQAAMILHKIPLKQRIGKISSLAPWRRPNTRSLMQNGASPLSPGRLGLGRAFKPRQGVLRRSNSYTSLRKPRTRQQSLSRANSVGDLSRSDSFGNLSQAEWQTNGSYPRGRRFGDRGTFRSNSRSRGSRGRGGGRNRGGGGRGGLGRGRGRGRGWNRASPKQGQSAPLSREELDRQLEQYMAGSRGQLDRELDTYMSTAMDTE